MSQGTHGLELTPLKGNKYKLWHPACDAPTIIEIVGDHYGGVLPTVFFNIVHGPWPKDKPGTFSWGSELHRRLHQLTETEKLLYG